MPTGDGAPGGRIDAAAEDAGRGHESGGARAHRVAEAVEDERWERTPRESFSISLAAQCRAQA